MPAIVNSGEYIGEQSGVIMNSNIGDNSLRYRDIGKSIAQAWGTRQPVIQNPAGSTADDEFFQSIQFEPCSRRRGSDLVHTNEARILLDITINSCSPQAVAFRLSSNHEESVLGKNRRRETHTPDIQDRGHYSEVIAKIRVSNNRYGFLHGTGTVIGDHHIITVGHNVWHPDFGLAESITISRDARASSEVDYRRVDAGVVHYHWATAFSQKNDFAVLHVSEPFPDEINRMAYRKTPSFEDVIKVYGFSRDMPKDKNGKSLFHLCHSFSYVQYSVGEPLLYHDGDTEKGSSGGPMVDPSGVMIAVHRSGGETRNKAIAINHHGNDVDKFIEIGIAMATKTQIDPPIKKSNEFTLYDSTIACFGWEKN
ncbi:hypothetical protein ABKA04_007094 [Annulohypoxylon sp. FPYF3050]